jgi:hypothetical protein
MSKISKINKHISSILAPFSRWQIALFASSLAALVVDIYLLFNSSDTWMLIISFICIVLGTLLGTINKLFYLVYLFPLALRVFGIIGLLPQGGALGINSGDLFLTANMMVVTALMPLTGAVLIYALLIPFAAKEN